MYQFYDGNCHKLPHREWLMSHLCTKHIHTPPTLPSIIWTYLLHKGLEDSMILVNDYQPGLETAELQEEQ